MKALFFGMTSSLFFGAISAALAAPPPVSDAVDVSGLLDYEASPEELMVNGGSPATPESGNENPQDLLKSGPVLHPVKKSKSASAKGATRDGMPDSLPLMPGSESTAPAALPPPPMSAMEDDVMLAPEVTTEIPTVTEETPETIAEEPKEIFEDVVVSEEPAPSPREQETAGSSTRKWDRSVPMYDRENPTWAIDLHGSLQALGTNLKSDELAVNGSLTGNIVESDVRNFGIGFEYEPEFLHSLGVVSLGPSFNFYVMEPQGDLTENAFSIYSAGISLKYQLKFMRGQAIVPFVGFEAQAIRYKFKDSVVGEGTTTASGLTFGALFLLNWMEPSAAHSLWSDTGIKRSYLVGEVKNLTADVAPLSSDGPAVYFGMRLEY